MRDNIDTILTAFKKWHTIPEHIKWNHHKLQFRGDGALSVNSQFHDFRYAWDVCITTYDIERINLYKQAWYDNLKVGDAVYWTDHLKNDDVDDSGIFEIVGVFEKSCTKYVKLKNDVGLEIESKMKNVKIVSISDNYRD